MITYPRERLSQQTFYTISVITNNIILHLERNPHRVLLPLICFFRPNRFLKPVRSDYCKVKIEISARINLWLLKCSYICELQDRWHTAEICKRAVLLNRKWNILSIFIFYISKTSWRNSPKYQTLINPVKNLHHEEFRHYQATSL